MSKKGPKVAQTLGSIAPPRDFVTEAKTMAKEQNNVVVAGLQQSLLTQSNIDLKNLLNLFQTILEPKDYENLIKESIKDYNNIRFKEGKAIDLNIENVDVLKDCTNKLLANITKSSIFNQKFKGLTGTVLQNISSNISNFENIKKGSDAFLTTDKNFELLAKEIELKKPSKLRKFKNLFPGQKEKFEAKQKIEVANKKVSNFQKWKDEMLVNAAAEASKMFIITPSQDQIEILKKIDHKSHETIAKEKKQAENATSKLAIVASATSEFVSTMKMNMVAEFFENQTQLDTQTVDPKSLNVHVKETFDFVIRAQSFDIMTDYLKQVAQIYQFGAEFDSEQGLDLKKEGFGRLQTSEFKVFAMTMLDNLGFDINDKNCFKKLASISTPEINKLRNEFAKKKDDESLDKFARAKDLFFKECEATKQTKDSYEYHTLMGFSTTALLAVESNQRMGNMTNLLPNIDDLMNYNAHVTYGAVAQAKHTAREMIKSNLVSIVSQTMESVDSLRKNAKIAGGEDVTKVHKAYWSSIQSGTKPQKSSSKNADTAWHNASTKAKESAIQDITSNKSQKKSIDQLMLSEFQASWKKEAVKLMDLMDKGGGATLYQKMIAVLENDLKDLKYSRASPEVIKAAEKKLSDFKNIFDPQKPNKENDLKKHSLEDLKGLCQAINTGLSTLSTPANLKHQSVDDQQLIVLMKQAFASLGSTITIPETLFAIYDEIIRTDRSRLDSQNPSFITAWIAEKGAKKIAEYMKESYEGPVIALQYFIEQKAQGKYNLTIPVVPQIPVQVPVLKTNSNANFTSHPQKPITAEPKQSWYQWGASIAGLELDPIKQKQNSAITTAKKLLALKGEPNDKLDYEGAKKVLAESDKIISAVKDKAVNAQALYQAAQHEFDQKLPSLEKVAKLKSQAIAQTIGTIADQLQEADNNENISMMLSKLDSIIATLEIEFNAAETAFAPHEAAYKNQGITNWSKTAEYQGTYDQKETIKDNLNEAIKLKNQIVSSHTEKEKADAAIDTSVSKVTTSGDSLNSKLVSIYNDLTTKDVKSKFPAITAEMAKLIVKLESDLAIAKEKVANNPPGYFYWTTSKTSLAAAAELADIQQKYDKMVQAKEKFDLSMGVDHTINAEIAKDLSVLAPEVIFDVAGERNKNKQAYDARSRDIANDIRELSSAVYFRTPYFAGPSFLKTEAEKTEQDYKNSIKFQDQLSLLKEDIQTAELIKALAETANEVVKMQKSANTDSGTSSAPGLTNALVSNLLYSYFTGEGLTSTVVKSLVNTYGSDAIHDASERAVDLESVLVHHLGKDNASTVKGYLQKIQGWTEPAPIDNDQSWRGVLQRGAWNGLTAGGLAAGTAAVFAIPTGPVGMLAAGTSAFVPAFAKGAAIAITTELASPVIVAVTQNAADIALRKALGHEATENFYLKVGQAKSALSSIASKADEITMSSVNDWYNKAPDKGNISKAIIEEGQKSFRGQTFDAFLDMMNNIHHLSEAMKNPLNNHMFAEMGFERLNSNDFQINQNMIIESLGFKPGDFNKSLDPKYVEGLRNKFIIPPKTDAEIQADPFAKLKTAVAHEYNDTLGLIKAGKLKDSCNYISLLSAMNSVVGSVESVQKITKVAELYMPDVNEAIGSKPDAKDKGLIQYLKENAARDLGTQAAKTGVAYMVQDTVNQAKGMASIILASANAKIEQQYSLVAAEQSKQSTIPRTPSTPSQKQDEPSTRAKGLFHQAPNQRKNDTPTPFVTSAASPAQEVPSTQAVEKTKIKRL